MLRPATSTTGDAAQPRAVEARIGSKKKGEQSSYFPSTVGRGKKTMKKNRGRGGRVKKWE
jgi:hypothetical protein